MSLKAVLNVAAGEVGSTELPANSNKTKYGAEYGLDGQPWCVMFLWWCFRHAGDRNAFFAGAKTASCGTLLRWYKEQGLTVHMSQLQRGDIVILNFDGTGDTSHCGIVESYSGGNFFTTIEGNTSGSGSQDNGGAVLRKTRYLSQIVGICRPQYHEDIITDYDNHWAKEAIELVKDEGLMQGYPDGNFKPDNNVTRAELATVLSRLIEKGALK